MRLFLLLLGLAVLVLIPFLWLGDDFMSRFGDAGARAWLGEYGMTWGWVAGLVLLVLDLFLPVPATSVISALGFGYGTLLGGLIGATGSFLSGVLAFELCRKFGSKGAERLLGAVDRAKAERIFAGGTGGWLIALSRWMPLVPEMVSCMAGLSGMPRQRFYSALACGCLPMAMMFAGIGATGMDRPGLALVLSAVIPALLYTTAVWWLRQRV